MPRQTGSMKAAPFDRAAVRRLEGEAAQFRNDGGEIADMRRLILTDAIDEIGGMIAPRRGGRENWRGSRITVVQKLKKFSARTSIISTFISSNIQFS